MILFALTSSRSMHGRRPDGLGFIGSRSPPDWCSPNTRGVAFSGCHVKSYESHVETPLPFYHLLRHLSLSRPAAMSSTGDSSWLTSINMQISSLAGLSLPELVTKNDVYHSSKPRRLRYTQLTVARRSELFLSPSLALTLISCDQEARDY